MFEREYKPGMAQDKSHSPGPGDDGQPPDPHEPARPSAPLDLEAFAATLKPGARLIGVDVGTKTLGLALSDVRRTLASGLETIRRKKFAPAAARLLEHCMIPRPPPP